MWQAWSEDKQAVCNISGPVGAPVSLAERPSQRYVFEMFLEGYN